MPIESSIKVSGAWKLLTDPEIKVSGAWKAITEIELKDAGVWKQVFVVDVSEIGGDWGAYAAPPATAFNVSQFETVKTAWVKLQFISDGRYTKFKSTGASVTEDWADNAPSTNGADYQLKWVKQSGDSPDTVVGAAEGVYGVMNITHSLYWEDTSAAGGDGKLAIVDIYLRYQTDDATIVQREILFQAEYESLE